MEASLWKITVGLLLSRASNDIGISARVEFFKTPYWEVEASVQLLFPWDLSFRVAQKV